MLGCRRGTLCRGWFKPTKLARHTRACIGDRLQCSHAVFSVVTVLKSRLPATTGPDVLTPRGVAEPACREGIFGASTRVRQPATLPQPDSRHAAGWLLHRASCTTGGAAAVCARGTVCREQVYGLLQRRERAAHQHLESPTAIAAFGTQRGVGGAAGSARGDRLRPACHHLPRSCRRTLPPQCASVAYSLQFTRVAEPKKREEPGKGWKAARYKAVLRM